jgi:hypothetical protein
VPIARNADALLLLADALTRLVAVLVQLFPLVAGLNYQRDRRSTTSHKLLLAVLGGYYHSKSPATILKFRTITNRDRLGLMVDTVVFHLNAMKVTIHCLIAAVVDEHVPTRKKVFPPSQRREHRID